jgi:hypothetical protein
VKLGVVEVVEAVRWCNGGGSSERWARATAMATELQ